MAGLLLLKRDILTPNEIGAVFVGAENNRLVSLDKTGQYPAARGSEIKNIFVNLEEREGSDGLIMILPYLYTLWVKVDDYQSGKVHEMTLLGKSSGLNVGEYQIESLGGKLVYLNNKLKIYSLESVEANSK